MYLLQTRQGSIINLDQVWMIEILADQIHIHPAARSEAVHVVEKKYLPEGEWERITEAIYEKVV
jgi:hypothetical protein